MRHGQQHTRRAFTLVEVLLVLVIIGLLAGVAIFALGGTQDRANIDTTRIKLQKLESAIQRFSLDTRRLPDGDDGLRGLVERPADEDLARNWSGPYATREDLRDAWGQDIRYEVVEEDGAGRRYRIWSIGPNGQDENGEGDDILPQAPEDNGGN